ncbi:MAG: hypothetical protein KatS3mg023_3709 [Armatimonadota bacterium]|nr:MAG: hypothetical protein KatS3mg023_3709 [Armatimonadota bacterium]
MPPTYRLPAYASDDTDFQISFAPSDCHAFVMLPVYDGTRMVTRITERLGEVVLFSLSSHRDKFPVSRLGRMLPIGFTAGRRTVAGTIGLVMWQRNALRRISERLYRAFPQFIGTPHADEFPPLDILLVFVNETGATVSVTLYGATILDEGMTLQTDDVRTVVTLSYMAVDYEINTSPIQSKRDTGHAVPSGNTRPAKPALQSVRVNRYELSASGKKVDELVLNSVSGNADERAVATVREHSIGSSELTMDLFGRWVEVPLPDGMMVLR